MVLGRLLEMDRPACPFCNLPPERIVGKTRMSLAFLNAFPLAEGYTIVIPKRYVASILDLPPEESATFGNTKNNPAIAKCFNFVDRKDLDRQTREEFNRFQEGWIEENCNILVPDRRLESLDYSDKVIVTVQKFGVVFDTSNKEKIRAAQFYGRKPR